jgi:hypothetical protein
MRKQRKIPSESLRMFPIPALLSFPSDRPSTFHLREPGVGFAHDVVALILTG